MSPTLHCACTPSLGAWVVPEGTAFRVWAPCSNCVDVIVEPLPARRAFIHWFDRWTAPSLLSFRTCALATAIAIVSTTTARFPTQRQGFSSFQPAHLRRTHRRAAWLDAEAVSSASHPSSSRASPSSHVDVSSGGAGRGHNRHPAGRITRHPSGRRAPEGGRCRRSHAWSARRVPERRARATGSPATGPDERRSGVQPGPVPPEANYAAQAPTIRFVQPSAVILRRKRERKLP